MASNIQQLVCGWLWRCVIVVVVVGKVLEAVSPLETSTAGSPRLLLYLYVAVAIGIALIPCICFCMFLLFIFQVVVGEDVNADASNDNRQSMRTTQMNLTMGTMANGIE